MELAEFLVGRGRGLRPYTLTFRQVLGTEERLPLPVRFASLSDARAEACRLVSAYFMHLARQRPGSEFHGFSRREDGTLEKRVGYVHAEDSGA